MKSPVFIGRHLPSRCPLLHSALHHGDTDTRRVTGGTWLGRLGVVPLSQWVVAGGEWFQALGCLWLLQPAVFFESFIWFFLKGWWPTTLGKTKQRHRASIKEIGKKTEVSRVGQPKMHKVVIQSVCPRLRLCIVRIGLPQGEIERYHWSK